MPVILLFYCSTAGRYFGIFAPERARNFKIKHQPSISVCIFLYGEHAARVLTADKDERCIAEVAAERDIDDLPDVSTSGAIDIGIVQLAAAKRMIYSTNRIIYRCRKRENAARETFCRYF